MSERDSMAGLRHEVAGLTHMVRAIAGASGATNGGNVTFTVNASGFGLRVAVMCCVVSLLLNLFMGAVLFWVAMDNRDRGHQVNAIYMSVPGLRELVAEQMRLNEQTQRATAEDDTP